MTERKLMQMIRMVLDGCTDLEDAKHKVDQLIDRQSSQEKKSNPKPEA